MRIERATPDDIRNVALRMRESDLEEFLALSFRTSREDLADDLVRRHAAHGIVAKLDGDAVAVGDAMETRPGVLTLWMFATDRFPEVALPLTRFVKKRLLAPLVAAGAHRIEAVSIAGHEQAHRWIKCLGLTYEATCRGYGKGGETFVQFAWVKNACTTGNS